MKLVPIILTALTLGCANKSKYIVPCTIRETKILMWTDLKVLFENEIERLEEEIGTLTKSKRLLLKTLKTVSL